MSKINTSWFLTEEMSPQRALNGYNLYRKGMMGSWCREIHKARPVPAFIELIIQQSVSLEEKVLMGHDRGRHLFRAYNVPGTKLRASQI